jgi:hypothetical protein
MAWVDELLDDRREADGSLPAHLVLGQ